MTESQKPPNADVRPVSVATLPSMKSKIFATIMITPAETKWPNASSQPAATLIRTPMNVRRLGCIRSRTHAAMIKRSGK